ncbi:hypothetical protein CMI47_14505 [Candidatus Pacearchaeota archaeon]|jgi:hypothetical protein|nr:hypothetical protein [Candidatus Pacearchaeota archaeon]
MKYNVMGYQFPLRPASRCRTDMRRTKPNPKRGDNIRFLATYLFENPGVTSSECRKALCEERGIFWEGGRQMRGQYTSYFSRTRYSSSWPNPPADRYWTKFRRSDGRIGWKLTLEGMGWVDTDRAFSGAA